MIFDRIENVAEYAPHIPYTKEILAFCREHDLKTLPEGRYELLGSDLFVNVQHAVTAPYSERGWESHAVYADLQLVVLGEESFGGFSGPVPEPDESKPDSDFYGYKSMPGPVSHLTCAPGDFVYFAPGEPHSPCCAEKAPQSIKKAVFKVRIGAKD